MQVNLGSVAASDQVTLIAMTWPSEGPKRTQLRSEETLVQVRDCDKVI